MHATQRPDDGHRQAGSGRIVAGEDRRCDRAERRAAPGRSVTDSCSTMGARRVGRLQRAARCPRVAKENPPTKQNKKTHTPIACATALLLACWPRLRFEALSFRHSADQLKLFQSLGANLIEVGEVDLWHKIILFEISKQDLPGGNNPPDSLASSGSSTRSGMNDRLAIP